MRSNVEGAGRDGKVRTARNVGDDALDECAQGKDDMLEDKEEGNLGHGDLEEELASTPALVKRRIAEATAVRTTSQYTQAQAGSYWHVMESPELLV